MSTRLRAPQGREQVSDIVGCRMVNGACVTHQRPLDTPRPGCPLVDSVMRQAQAGGRR